jgi:hypothetical protein
MERIRQEALADAAERRWDAQQARGAARAEISDRFRRGEIELEEAWRLLSKVGGVG